MQTTSNSIITCNNGIGCFNLIHVFLFWHLASCPSTLAISALMASFSCSDGTCKVVQHRDSCSSVNWLRTGWKAHGGHGGHDLTDLTPGSISSISSPLHCSQREHHSRSDMWWPHNFRTWMDSARKNCSSLTKGCCGRGIIIWMLCGPGRLVCCGSAKYSQGLLQGMPR